MIQLILAVLVLMVGYQAYVRAKREGTWSWKKFAYTMLGVLAICAVTILWVLFLMRTVAPEHPGTAIALILLIIFALVTALALVMRPKRKA
ncbi:MAG: hypothetical protein ACRD50_08335 [Candidatus Acidiferrales bacterium]